MRNPEPRACRAAIVLIFLGSTLGVTAQDCDTDGDGLSDFQERHKYFTNPQKADSDGDGIADSDWNERREFSYTVRSVLHVMPPYNLAAMNDDYQDVRMLDEHTDYLEVEVIHYPFNTCQVAIEANPNWRQEYASMREYLDPDVTTNWNKRMQRMLRSRLNSDGIDVTALTDREVVEKVSKWLLDHAKVEDGFTAFTLIFSDGKPEPAPGLEGFVEKKLQECRRTLHEQLRREVYGRGMFETGRRGTCTSTAVYLTTGLRAVGIPTRMIICVPVVDPSDDRELEFVNNRLTNHRVRKIVRDALSPLSNSWSSHTFNEVYVGGRWRRLNYARLGQNTLDPGYFGLMTHVHTFNDLATAGLVPWGRRSLNNSPNDVFGHANPYSCISLSDQFGRHAKIANPLAEEEHYQLTVSRIYWFDDPKKPQSVQMRLDYPDTAGHLVMHVEESFPEAGSSQYDEFYERVRKDFLLRADGHDDIRALATRGYWIDVSRDVKDFYLQILPGEFKKMKTGVAYELLPLHSHQKYGWIVSPGATIIRSQD